MGRRHVGLPGSPQLRLELADLRLQASSRCPGRANDMELSEDESRVGVKGHAEEAGVVFEDKSYLATQPQPQKSWDDQNARSRHLVTTLLFIVRLIDTN